MSSTASVGGDDRLRLFLGLRLPEPALDEVEAWQRAQLERMRVVPRAHLHVTLAFLGHRPAGDLPGVLEALREAAGAVEGELRLTPVRYRETRSVAMLVCEDEGGRAGLLAADLQERLERLGVYRREARPWLPHLTVIRFRERPRGHREGATPPLPELGEVAPSDAAVFISRLRRDGAQYLVYEAVTLGG